MKLVNIYILMLFVLGLPNVNAQTDMVMLRPIDFSPGMVGNKESCISLSVRNVNFTSELNSYNASLSYEFLSKKLKGGIGVSYTSSLTSFKNSESFVFGKNSSQRLNFVYAPKMVIKKKIQFSPFIKMSAMHINTDVWQNNFEQDIRQMPIQLGNKHNVLATSLGFLVNQRRWFIGAETYGANTLLIHNKKLSKAIGIKYQVGGFFNFNPKRNYGISFILAQDFQNDGEQLFNANNSILSILKLNQINVLLSYHSDQFGALNSSSTRLGLGYQPSKRIKIGYSIGLDNKSWLHLPDHQIGFQYIFKKKDDKTFFAG